MELQFFIAEIILIALTYTADAKKLFNPDTSFCCNAKVIPFAKEKVHRGMVCCKQAVYDWKTEICCEEKIFKLPVDESTLENASASGLLSILQPTSFRKSYFGSPYSCCGSGKTTTIYNHEKEHCCEGRVHRMPAESPHALFPTTFACCNRDIYNTSSHDCCLGTSNKSRQLLLKATRDEFCCGDRLIDYSKNLCCMRNYSDVTERPGIFKIDRPTIGCCASNKYYYDRSICCSDKIIPLPSDLQDRWHVQCCGNKLFDNRDINKICCDGQLLEKTSPKQTCCNKQIYDLREKICCDGRLHSLDESLPLDCCGSNAFTNQSTCCRKTLTVLSLDGSDARQCCD